MTRIDRIARATVPNAGRGGAVPSAGFVVPEGGAAPSAPVAPAALEGLVALQEAGQQGVRDREARRHGAAMLEVLRALQRALLEGAAPDALERLAGLVRAAPSPEHPGLIQVQRLILQRAAVELARARLCGSRATPTP